MAVIGAGHAKHVPLIVLSINNFYPRDEEAIQALSRAIRAGVTHGELGGERQSSSSSLEATSDGAAELSEGGEGGHASSSSGRD